MYQASKLTHMFKSSLYSAQTGWVTTCPVSKLKQSLSFKHLSSPSALLSLLPPVIDTVYARSSMTTPDLLIVVNFTALGITSDTFIDTRLSAVSIVVGLTNNTADVLDSTSPTPLVPGTYLFGGVSREFRRRFVKPPMAALGVLTVRDLIHPLTNSPRYAYTSYPTSHREHSKLVI